MKITFETIAAVLLETIPCEASKITPDALIMRDLGADSRDVVEIVMALEDEFGIDIPDDSVEQLAAENDGDISVQQIIDYLSEAAE